MLSLTRPWKTHRKAQSMKMKFSTSSDPTFIVTWLIILQILPS